MNEQAEKKPPGPDMGFLYLTGALLALIIALLAGLWLSARARALRAEGEAGILRRQEEGGRVLLRQLLKEQPVLGIDRSGLASQPATVDGKKVTALRLPAALAEAMGFLPGDVVLVEEKPPATATAPAPASADTPERTGG